MIRILIADDHAVVREGLKQILSGTRDLIVADEASNATEVMEKIHKNHFDVLILDISMPGRSGLDILKEIKEQKPKLQVLVLSMYPEEQYAVRVLKAGAAGYLTKESAPSKLITAIRHISYGRKYVNAMLAEKIAFDLQEESKKPLHENLSNREFQVFRMIISGKTVKEIAQILSLSDKTISTYRSRILEKMGMKNNIELTRYAVEQRLIE
jgi:two-component system invasion response regulator UvrY